jgi:glucose-6-phosphate isomerase
MAADPTIVYGGMLEETLGAGRGISREVLEALGEETPRAREALAAKRESGRVGFFDLPGRREQIPAILETAADLRGRFRNLLVLGIGGSALGASALIRALTPFFGPDDGALHVQCLDNVDPAWFYEAVGVFKPEETAYLAISKSGETPETLAQYLVIREFLRARVIGDWTSRVVCITDEEEGPLRAEVREHGVRSFAVPGNVGGRFSVLSPVGLLPAACAGIDVAALLDGAARAQERCEVEDLLENPGYLLGALLYLADRKLGARIHVMMPYRRGLWETALWFRQLWAESLGKTEGVGPTPIAALGTTDQHGQMQLYVEGPRDKVVIFVEVEDHGVDVEIPRDAPEALAHLAGATLGGLLHAELVGSRAALVEAGRPVLTVRLPRLDAGTLGALLQTLMIATAFAGELYGVDAYDQPGVRAGKDNAAALLGEEGLVGRAEALRKASEALEQHRL